MDINQYKYKVFYDNISRQVVYAHYNVMSRYVPPQSLIDLILSTQSVCYIESELAGAEKDG